MCGVSSVYLIIAYKLHETWRENENDNEYKMPGDEMFRNRLDMNINICMHMTDVSALQELKSITHTWKVLQIDWIHTHKCSQSAFRTHSV